MNIFLVNRTGDAKRLSMQTSKSRRRKIYILHRVICWVMVFHHVAPEPDQGKPAPASLLLFNTAYAEVLLPELNEVGEFPLVSKTSFIRDVSNVLYMKTDSSFGRDLGIAIGESALAVLSTRLGICHGYNYKKRASRVVDKLQGFQ